MDLHVSEFSCNRCLVIFIIIVVVFVIVINVNTVLFVVLVVIVYHYNLLIEKDHLGDRSPAEQFDWSVDRVAVGKYVM